MRETLRNRHPDLANIGASADGSPVQRGRLAEIACINVHGGVREEQEDCVDALPFGNGQV